MASELRVNTINSRTGFGTITVSETGQDLVGITTIENLTTENTLVGAAASFTGNVQIGGVLTYEDVTNIDSVGLITARSGIEIGARPGVAASVSVDGNAIFSGITTVGSLKLGGSTITTLGAANLILSADSGGIVNVSDSFDCDGNATFDGDVSIADKIIHTGDTDTAIRFSAADTVSVETGGTERLSISSTINIPDSTQLELGAGSDLKIWHSGSNSFIRNETGNLIIEANGAGDNAIEIIPDGSVWIAYDNSNKIKTTATGCQITSGAVNTTKLHIGQTADRGLEITTTTGSGNVDSEVTFNACDTESSGYHANLVFQLADVEKARFHGNGDYFALSNTCTGITFNGDYAAVNQLNDYEEGTWTPSIGTTSGATATGEYRKIGKSVFIQMYVSIPSHSNSSTMSISGLPFSSMSGKYASFVIGNYRKFNMDGGYTTLRVNQAGTTMTFRETGDSQTWQNAEWSQVQTDFAMYLSGTYFVD